MKLLYIPLISIATGLGLLVSLAFPADGNTWSSNPTHYFLGAEVFPATEIDLMKKGELLQFSDGKTPTEPKQFADRIIQTAYLTESENPSALRYYVVPRLHPQLELFIPALLIMGIGFISYIIILKIKGLTKISSEPRVLGPLS